MATLQQASYVKLNYKEHSSEFSRILCFHRRANIALILNSVPSMGENDKGKLILSTWNPEISQIINSYLIGSNTDAEKQILTALPIEGYDAFVLLV